ncbi:MAG: hypothetical protein IPG96_15335 [Proteobacteria bacterium]|nr:hypothetical protein [Pseudomonadota bacterium]
MQRPDLSDRKFSAFPERLRCFLAAIASLGSAKSWQRDVDGDASMRHNGIMRTTVNVPEHLLVQAKQLAAARHTSLTELLADSLRMYLAHQLATTGADDIEPLPVIRDARPRKGVNLTDTSALWELE